MLHLLTPSLILATWSKREKLLSEANKRNNEALNLFCCLFHSKLTKIILCSLTSENEEDAHGEDGAIEKVSSTPSKNGQCGMFAVSQ